MRKKDGLLEPDEHGYGWNVSTDTAGGLQTPSWVVLTLGCA